MWTEAWTEQIDHGYEFTKFLKQWGACRKGATTYTLHSFKECASCNKKTCMNEFNKI